MSPDGTGEPSSPAQPQPESPRTRTGTRSSRDRRSVVASSSKSRLDDAEVSPRSRPRPSAATTTTSIHMHSPSKGKGKATAPLAASAPASPSKAAGRRVLPARLRRAAGGGQDGVRDLEEMIVDWLDRYGYPSDTPPGKLQVTITSLPLNMVDPPPYRTGPAEHVESVTVTPHAGPSRQGIIETPDWVLVKAGQDDQEEARDELSARAGIALSPVRRLRRLSVGDDHMEDTSDEHYLRVHKKYEAFEKRQRKDERDKLAFERYKMRTRIDLMRGMSLSAWSTVVNTVMAREDSSGYWLKGKEKVKAAGVDWLRRRLVREGEEVLKRYDQLLPSDTKRSRMQDSRTSTPAISLLSASPPPAVLPARVAALKDSANLQRRKSMPSKTTNGSTPKRKRQTADPDPEPSPARLARRSRSSPRLPTPPTSDLSELSSDDEHDTDAEAETETATAESPRSMTVSTSASASPAPSSGQPPPRIGTRPTRASTRIVPPKKPPTRISARLSRSAAVVESEHLSDDTKSDETPITGSTDHADLLPRVQTNGALYIATLPQVDVTADEQLEMDRVEAAVVI